MATVSIYLNPVAGFCIKSSTTQSSLYASQTIPTGHKVFINIAWDSNVPAPPAGSEEVIQRAMKGEDVDHFNPNGWYVPVIVSEGRQEMDKAGKSSLVFDCIYNASVKSRTLTDPEFKLFLIELALQRLEAQTSLVLSRQIGTPNIASKGKLRPRTVSIPSALAGNSNVSRVPATTLIHEVNHNPSKEVPFDQKMKGILKSNSLQKHSIHKANSSRHARPTWSWSKEGDRLTIVISVPSLVPSAIAHATLDVEPRRFIFSIPDFPTLDVNLDLSDAEIVSRASSSTSVTLQSAGTESSNILSLKRQRDLDVDKVNAEWKVGDNVLVVTA